MKNNKNLLIGVTIFLLIIVTYGNIVLERNISVKEFNIEMVISENKSIEQVEKGVIVYSRPGEKSSFPISIGNNEGRDRRVEIEITGELVDRDLFRVSEKNFEIESGEKKNIGLAFRAPEENEGSYNAKLRIKKIG